MKNSVIEFSGPRRVAPGRRRVSAGVLAAVAGVCLGVGAGVVPAAAVPAVGSAPAASSKAAVPKGLESFYGQKVEWYDCVATAGVEKSADKTGFQCAKVKVPLDYSKPDGQTIEIAMKKHSATGSVRQGTLFMNPGGPGGSGVDDVGGMVTSTFAGVQKSYDIIGFDPRGVGSSTPITCGDGAGQQPANAAQGRMGVNDSQPGSLVADVAGDDPTPFRDAENPAADGGAEANVGFPTLIEEITKDFKQEEANCAAHTKPAGLLDHVDTVSVARDLDVLRALSGDQKLNFLGFSYGTYLGATYAELFPANTGRLVLDGAVDPSLSAADLALGQAKGFEASLRAYVQNCQSSKLGCPLSGDVDSGVSQVREFLESTKAAPLPTSDDKRPLTYDLAVYGVLGSMYQTQLWPSLTLALSQAMGKVGSPDGSALLAIADAVSSRQSDGSYSGNGAEALMAVNCLDYPVQGDNASWEKNAKAIKETSPTFGSQLLYPDAYCQGWGHTSNRKREKITASGAAPILVVGTTGDPATPYAWSEALADQLESGQLMTWKGNGHTAYGRSNDCVKKAVDTYLLNGTMPAKGLTC